MPHDYRLALRAKGIKPLRKKLRTTRTANDVEIVVDKNGKSRLHYYGEMK